MKKSIKIKLGKAKVALNTTIGKILDINRKRKKLQLEDLAAKEEELNQELKLLNKLADQQANLIRKYEHSLAREEVGAS